MKAQRFTELSTTENTQRAERLIRSAFRTWKRVAGVEFRTVYEHGQWWVVWDHYDEDEPVFIYSVKDASGPGSVFGFSFELMP